MQLSHPDSEKVIRDLVEWARAQETEVARAAAAKWAMTLMAEVTGQLSEVRIEAIRSLWTQGWSLADISEALEISRARVHQIIEK